MCRRDRCICSERGARVGLNGYQPCVRRVGASSRIVAFETIAKLWTATRSRPRQGRWRGPYADTGAGPRPRIRQDGGRRDASPFRGSL